MRYCCWEGKGYIPSENIPSENIPSENILSEEKANQPLPQTDSWRKKLKEASEKYHQEEQERAEKEQEALEKEKTLWKKISKKDKEEIKYLEREIKSEEALMSSLSRDRRAVEEWIKTGDLGVFNHYKIYGADAEAVRKQYERGGVESFRSQYGLAQKRIKKHTTQIEKIKQKYAETEKPCKTCKKSAKNVGKGHVLSEEKIRFKDLDRSEFESYEKNEMVRKKLGLGKEYQGKVYVEKYIVETYHYGAKFHKSKQNIRIGKLDDCQKIELDGRILFISKKKTLDYFTEENAEVRRKVAEEIRKKRREERKVKETENLSDYLDELYQKMLKLDPRAKPLLYQEVSKKFDIHKIQARFFHEEARKVEANFGMKKSPKGEFSDLIDSIFAVDFDRFFNERKAEGNFIRYYYTDFSNEIISYIAKRQNWKKYGLAAPPLSTGGLNYS